MADSSTGGYLLPGDTPAAPATDLALDGIFQQLVVNLTGLPGNMVRPRWQPTPPQEPGLTEDWAAVGVTQITPEGYSPSITHSSSADTLNRHERIEVTASFYGPDGQSNASIVRDGICIPQNMEALNALAIGLIDASVIRSVPELVNQRYRRRYDLTLTFRRQIVRVYPILDIASSESIITSDTPPYTETVLVHD